MPLISSVAKGKDEPKALKIMRPADLLSGVSAFALAESLNSFFLTVETKKKSVYVGENIYFLQYTLLTKS